MPVAPAAEDAPAHEGGTNVVFQKGWVPGWVPWITRCFPHPQEVGRHRHED